jgi:Ca-activated chloride channel family protein
MNEHLSLSSTVVLTPRRRGLRAGEDNLVEVLVRVQAPDAPAGHEAARPPQALALVIDRSGSMAGEPLHEACRCAGLVAARLRPADRVALVSFDHRVAVLRPAEPLGDGSALRELVAAIAAGGNTDLHGGWQAGAAALAELGADSPAALRRVMLLSDGQANAGLTDTVAIVAQVAQAAAAGMSTSTYGLGRGFNEQLMVAMAQAGQGGSYYGDTAQDLLEPFERELDLLGNLCLTRLALAPRVPDGVQLRCVNELPATADGIALPDLAWGAEAWVVLQLQVPAAMLPPAGQVLPLLQVAVRGHSLQGEPVQLERAALALPVLPARDWEALPQDALVLRRVVELQAAQALAAMRTAAMQGDWPAVDAMLDRAQVDLAGHDWVDGVLQGMREIASSRQRDRMMKEALYSRAHFARRLASKDEGAAPVVGEDVPAFLRRKRMQGKGEL